MEAYALDPLIERLATSAEAEYASFNQSLMPGAGGVFLGVRMPVLRSIAREIVRAEDWRGFLEASRSHGIFEIRLLHGMVVGGARCEIGEKLALTDAFLPYVDDWGLCDGTCSSFKPKRQEREPLFAFVCACAESDEEFRKRFGYVMLMNHFRDDEHIARAIEIYRGFHHEGYYARMGAAWGLATLWLGDREGCLAILEENLWDTFTHNKAIQKLCESRRVSEEDKARVRGLRRKREAKT